jgi:anthranilate synthase component 1
MKNVVYSKSIRVLGDLQTPVGIYLKMRDLYPESVLLESSDFHGGENSYSFIGLKPIARFCLDKGMITEEYPNGRTEKIKVDESVHVPEIFQRFVQSFKPADMQLPADINGFFGYTSYDAVSHFEMVDTRKQETAASSIPEMLYIYYRYIIVVDHFKNELTLVENLFEGEESNIRSILNLLENRNFAVYDFQVKGEETSSVTDEQYMEMVSQGIKHCKRGDVFQIVLSRCFRQNFSGDDFLVYRSLRSVNPSPYLFYFDFGSFRIFGSSPETHCKIKNGRAYIDPIAGTVPRTGDETKDRELTEKLLQDPKENAEHVMLVDLARNDLSRNTSHVRIEFYKEVQYYSHVIHLVSRVSGEMQPGSNPIRVFADTFPAGTLSGAPKVRAMELIRDIEKSDRGFYGGCIGYIGLNGDLNQAITIRSFLSKNNTLYYQAGAGIVNRSVESSELQEVNNKLGALKKAIDLAAKK